jgi:hypothetical protein
MTPIQHSISLEQAIDLTTRYRSNQPADMPICETFEKDSVIKLLAEEGAVNLRIYYGQKENGEICAVLVAADEAGNDILPEQNRTNDNEEALILEESYRCPYLCPPESPLNP